MGIGFSLFLIALGAILEFAVRTSVNGVNVHVVGVILMVVGALGIVLELLIFMPRRRRHLRAVPVADSQVVVPEDVSRAY